MILPLPKAIIEEIAESRLVIVSDGECARGQVQQQWPFSWLLRVHWVRSWYAISVALSLTSAYTASSQARGW